MYKITKPIRLIELFAGIGSQYEALKRIGADVTSHCVVEFDKNILAAYNYIHNSNYDVKDITKIDYKALNIVDTDNFEYIMTYSFPCQDLSLVGDKKGMSKGDNTRSGLLWEVERLLDETINDGGSLSQILLMENVSQILSKKNINDFKCWMSKLESLGYFNYVEILNAKDYGVPQNRKRCFMVSILGGDITSYRFPEKVKLEKTMQDYLQPDNEIDSKYYLSSKMKRYISSSGTKNFRNNESRINLPIARPLTTAPNKRAGTTNYICNTLPLSFNLCEECNLDEHNIRRLTPLESYRLMGFNDSQLPRFMSDAQLYKQSGNSIVVDVLCKIFKELI